MISSHDLWTPFTDWNTEAKRQCLETCVADSIQKTSVPLKEKAVPHLYWSKHNLRKCCHCLWWQLLSQDQVVRNSLFSSLIVTIPWEFLLVREERECSPHNLFKSSSLFLLLFLSIYIASSSFYPVNLNPIFLPKWGGRQEWIGKKPINSFIQSNPDFPPPIFLCKTKHWFLDPGSQGGTLINEDPYNP